MDGPCGAWKIGWMVGWLCDDGSMIGIAVVPANASCKGETLGSLFVELISGEGFMGFFLELAMYCKIHIYARIHFR